VCSFFGYEVLSDGYDEFCLLGYSVMLPGESQ
jgi:hypothetical protein